MKKFIKTVLFAVLILLSVLVLGFLVPTCISLFIVNTTETTMTECVQSVPFWLFTIIGSVTSSIYINEVVKTNY